MKRWLKLPLGVVIVVFVGIQFIPIERNKIEIPTSADFIEFYEPPIAVKNIIRSSCYDCHSNQTRYPWYSKIQPIGLLLQNHISEGKSELNFTEFGNQSERMKKMKLKSILSQIEDDKMPIPSYVFLHPEAKLDPFEKTLIIDYIDSLTVNITN